MPTHRVAGTQIYSLSANLWVGLRLDFDPCGFDLRSKSAGGEISRPNLSKGDTHEPRRSHFIHPSDSKHLNDKSAGPAPLGGQPYVAIYTSLFIELGHVSPEVEKHRFAIHGNNIVSPEFGIYSDLAPLFENE